jgi:hypothetical protein
LAFSLALAKAGNKRPARIAMMAITTNSSIKVNAPKCLLRSVFMRVFGFPHFSDGPHYQWKAGGVAVE